MSGVDVGGTMHHGDPTMAVGTSGGGGGRLPVFVFPASLIFYADDQSSQKQVMTLYNPYDFPLRFKVLSTAPRKYVVLDAEGTIKPRCCIDIVVRHNAILPCNYGVIDKFRVQMSESTVVGSGSRRTGPSASSSMIVGRKDVPATLKATSNLGNSGGGASGSSIGSAGMDTSVNEHFEQLVTPTLAHTRAQQYSIGGGLLRQENEGRGFGAGGGPNLFVIMAALVCILALLLPTEGQEPTSSLPSYLHLSVPMKLIFSYALGLVTMVILKT